MLLHCKCGNIEKEEKCLDPRLEICNECYASVLDVLQEMNKNDFERRKEEK